MFRHFQSVGNYLPDCGVALLALFNALPLRGGLGVDCLFQELQGLRHFRAVLVRPAAEHFEVVENVFKLRADVLDVFADFPFLGVLHKVFVNVFKLCDYFAADIFERLRVHFHIF